MMFPLFATHSSFVTTQGNAFGGAVNNDHSTNLHSKWMHSSIEEFQHAAFKCIYISGPFSHADGRKKPLCASSPLVVITVQKIINDYWKQLWARRNISYSCAKRQRQRKWLQSFPMSISTESFQLFSTDSTTPESTAGRNLHEGTELFSFQLAMQCTALYPHSMEMGLISHTILASYLTAIWLWCILLQWIKPQLL